MQQREDAITKIRAYLRDGGLRPGDRLPGERDLSAMLRIGRTGLRPVLADLEAEGYLERRPQSGTYLTQLPPSAARGQSVSLIAPFGDRTQPGRQEWLYRVAVAFERSAIAAGLRVAVRDQAPFLRDDSSVKTMALEAARSGA